MQRLSYFIHVFSICVLQRGVKTGGMDNHLLIKRMKKQENEQAQIYDETTVMPVRGEMHTIELQTCNC